MTETFYDRLDVAEDATTAEIETAYREAIKRVHPDVSDDVDAGERTKRLNKAKRVLTDEEERARYDRLGHETYTGDDTDGTGGNGSSSGSSRARETTVDEASATHNGTAAGADTASRASAGWGRGSGPGSGSGSGSDTDDTGSSESTWRGSQQRGRRSARGPNGRESGRRRRERTNGWRGGETGSSGTRKHADGTTRSRGDSTGPSWQSNSATAGRASPSARRQAAAGATDGPNADWSWNAWDTTRSWAVRQGSDGRTPLRLSRIFPLDQSVVLLASTFFLYPFFVGAMLFPPFPLIARFVVAVCTLLTFAYLLSIPEAAVGIFGLWSVVALIFLLAFPGVSVFSLVGVIALTTTWVPLGLSVLTLSLVRP
ncbi:DnaJ domain-containing protein [Halosimplex salinum]|uniref:DnaJ domain-containing protein n=1 Tax=Halosimplex salinum TaxID=1710538 RepID=UPI000F492660|nr:DnaJ domain-containing protein [Halosimplex salinum]